MRAVAFLILFGLTPLRAENLKSLEFTPERITATGAKHGARVLFFGIARVNDGYYSHVVRHKTIVSDDDRDGIVTLELNGGVPFKSIWAAIDLESGAYLIGTPPGYPQRVKGTEAPVKRVDGRLERIETSGGTAELLVVRRNVGAWHLTVIKDSPLDANRWTEEPIAVDVRKLKSIDREVATPTELQHGDVVIAIDPQWMELRAGEVKP